jgi:1-deoxy-D-xylulose-5-phosphate reductoisomerase
MKKIVILGSTGSIGENALKVVDSLPDKLQVMALGVNTNYQRVLEQAKQFGVKIVAVADPEMAAECAKAAPAGVEVLCGEEGIEAAAALDDIDIVVCAVVGMAGLKPTMAAVSRGTDVAIATKEALVAAGDLVTEMCAETGASLLPVDSEHSALFQCLTTGGRTTGEGSNVKRLILTASGGPFAFKKDIDLAQVSVKEALNHPRWKMGPKVTIDSATLMNKGLEIIEARWLFNLTLDKIDVVLHPESIVHSLVEFVDGSMLAQMSMPDMRLAIQYALTYPERYAGDLPSLDLAQMGALHFSEPDMDRFPCLKIAREALLRGGTLPTVMNAANEVAVAAFLEEKIPLSGIWHLVEEIMNKHDVIDNPDLSTVFAADKWAREVDV